MSVFVDIEKDFGSFRLKTQFEAGDETLALLGASGCGKSMTLKCIAGIVRPDRGKIVVDGVTLFDSERRIDLTPQERRTGLMFQNFALFPHMTVFQNVQAGANRERNAASRREAVESMLSRFGLLELADRYPSQISGGQQQRVALARILVSNPRILLLDEPFSALDSHLRFRLEQEVRRVIGDFGGSVILVSHDRDEVFRLSDRIAIMHEGCIETMGAKKEVFKNPRTKQAAILTGCKNISIVRPLDETHVQALEWGIPIQISGSLQDVTAVGVRMHSIRAGSGENAFRCVVEQEIENPFSYTIMLRPEGKECRTPIGWELDKEDWMRLRGPVQQISIPACAILLLKEGSLC